MSAVYSVVWRETISFLHRINTNTIFLIILDRFRIQWNSLVLRLISDFYC